MEKSSRLSGFYKLTRAERIAFVSDWASLTEADTQVLLSGGLSNSQATQMVENGLGTLGIPLGVAVNFTINGKDKLIPMAVEEPSVIAAVSNAARIVRTGGGFETSSSDPIMIGQIQVLDVPDLLLAKARILHSKDELMKTADSISTSIVKRGGGSRDIEVRIFEDSPMGAMMVVHLLYDTRDAMGANAINTAVETIAPRIAELTGGRTNLRILSNLSDRRTATARCLIPHEALVSKTLTGRSVAQFIAEANAFAVVDPYRATTHNKGIMNGIDAVCIATGNDWRAIEAGAHAYAARNGQYSAMTDWHLTADGDLYGELTIPMAVGIVGGATKVHPTAQVAMKILNIEHATDLAEIMVCVGLAQNLAAIRALATTGIQAGHMKMHARQVALAAGAPDELVAQIAEQLTKENNIRVHRAKEILDLQTYEVLKTS